MNVTKTSGLILSIFLLGLLTAYYFIEPLSSGDILSYRDLSRYFYPLRLFTADCVKSGVLPLWNPYIFSGAPHLALQQSVIFYPLSLIYYLAPFDLAFNLFLVVHIFLLGLFTYLLARQWGFGESPALLSAVVFMFSGYVISVINLATTLSSMIWLPLVLLFFDRALKAAKAAADISFASLSLAAMFLGGEPSVFYTTIWVLLFYMIFFLIRDGKGSSPKRVLAVYVSVVTLAILLSSVQLMPFLELLRHADRGRGASYETATIWSLPLKDTLSFILPFSTRTDFSRDSLWKEQNWAFIIYAGALAPLFVFLALFFRRNWRTIFLFFAGLLFLLFAYGGQTPIYRLIYRFVPGFKFVRYPVRFLHITTFAVAMLCGAGFDAYRRLKMKPDEGANRFFGRLLLLLYLGAILFLAFSIYRDEIIGLVRSLCFRPPHAGQKTGWEFLVMAANIFNFRRFLGFLISGGLILFLGLKTRIRQGIVAFAVISLVIVDFLSVFPGGHASLNAGVFHHPAGNMAFLAKDKTLFRFLASPEIRKRCELLKGDSYERAIEDCKEMFAADWPMIYGLYDAGGYDSIRLKNYTKVMNLVDSSCSPSDTKILDMLNVKYVASSAERDFGGYRLVRKARSACIYENLNALPRAFLVDSFKVITSEKDMAERLKSKEFNPAREVILEEEPLLALSRKLKAISGKEKVDIVKYSPNEVVLKAAANGPKFLVLSDAWYPGWKVYVDGARKKLYRANYTLRAVYLDAGSHDVRFIFDPFTFKLGAAISLSSLLFIGLFFAFRKNR